MHALFFPSFYMFISVPNLIDLNYYDFMIDLDVLLGKPFNLDPPFQECISYCWPFVLPLKLYKKLNVIPTLLTFPNLAFFSPFNLVCCYQGLQGPSHCHIPPLLNLDLADVLTALGRPFTLPSWNSLHSAPTVSRSWCFSHSPGFSPTSPAAPFSVLSSILLSSTAKCWKSNHAFP